MCATTMEKKHMKQIAKTTLALVALLAVSACSIAPESNVYSDYDYNPAANQSVLVTDLM